jgi:CHASE2 domain-containing sensor protein
VRDPLLWLHVATGTTGLLTGPLWVAVRLRGRRGDGLAWAYLLAVAAVAVSGGVLAVTTPGLAWLLPVAVLTGGLAVAGALARRRAWPHWRTLQPHLLGGSYLALVTGALVASTGDPVWWVLPGR